MRCGLSLTSRPQATPSPPYTPPTSSLLRVALYLALPCLAVLQYKPLADATHPGVALPGCRRRLQSGTSSPQEYRGASQAVGTAVSAGSRRIHSDEEGTAGRSVVAAAVAAAAVTTELEGYRWGPWGEALVASPRSSSWGLVLLMSGVFSCCCEAMEGGLMPCHRDTSTCRSVPLYG